MRLARFKSRRRRLVICPADGYFWMYRGLKDENGRISCPSCKQAFRLGEISLRKRKVVA